MSNEKAMSLEERIVQRLKSDTLFSLVGDEDAITELTRRAIREALFKDREVVGARGYGTDKHPAPAVAAAFEVAKKAAESILADEVARLKADPTFAKMVRDALADSILKALDYTGGALVSNIVGQAIGATRSQIGEHIRSGRPLDQIG